MIFRTPISFDEAAERLRALGLLPASPGSAEDLAQTKAQIQDLARAAANEVSVAPGLPADVAAADLASLLEVRREWLAPVLPFLHRLEAVAGDPRLSPEEFVARVQSELLDVPELSDQLNTDALATALEARLGRAALAGVASTLSP